MKKLIYLLTIISTVFVFSSCKKDIAVKDLIGNWECYRVDSYESNGELDPEDSIPDSSICFVDLQDGGKCNITMGGKNSESTWSYDKSSKVLKLDISGHEMSLTVLELDSANAKLKHTEDDGAYDIYYARKK